ncbi:MAG TPA: site-specific integrase [Anaerolineaceae bacterium]|nr:site-specific integrase [Anaerolineaceae bacterium]
MAPYPATGFKNLSYAVRWNLVARNVSDLVDEPAYHRIPVEPLTVEQVNILLDAVSNHPYFPLYVATCYLGLRQGEVLGIHVEGLDRNHGLIFTTRSGKPIGPRNLVRHFKSVLKKAGLPDVRFHDLRHTTASLHIQSGAHPKELQNAMRHSSWNLSMDTYGHLMPGMANDAAGRLNKLLGRDAKP